VQAVKEAAWIGLALLMAVAILLGPRWLGEGSVMQFRYARRTIIIAAIAVVFWIPYLYSQPIGVRQFKNFVQVSPFADGDHWFLTEELVYDVLNTGTEIPVRQGFVTDFASVPRLFWTLLPPWGKYGPPAVVHDFLYWDQGCTREQADRIMVLAMQESGVGWFRTGLIRAAVRVGGAFAWASNRSAREEGTIRDIPEALLPEKPNVTWAEYEKRLREEYNVTPIPSPEPPPEYCAKADKLWAERMGND
jgi:Protein of unknown function (DUF1353)